MRVILSPFNMILPIVHDQAMLDMNRKTEPGSRTKFSPWFGLLHVNLGCFIHHDVHELVEALWETKEGQLTSSHSALESTTENGAGGGRECEGTNMDANTKENFRFTIHPDTTGVVCSTPAWCVG